MPRDAQASQQGSGSNDLIVCLIFAFTFSIDR
jgi:hypothetical protein